MTESVAGRVSAELNEGLYDLRQATDKAIEEGFLVPSGIALENADRLLREMYGLWRGR